MGETSTPVVGSTRTSILGYELTPIVFIDDVAAHVAKFPSEEVAQRALQDAYGKYKSLESTIVANRGGLQRKIPDLKSTLQSVQYLRSKMAAGEAVRTHFELNSQLYASARVQNVQHVSLWLGANVMVEYTFDEAEALLTQNIQQASESLKKLDDEIQFVKEQIITAEVNIARVINFGVAQRKAAAIAAATSAVAATSK